MNFNAYTPGAAIAPCIERIFHYTDFQPDHSIERVIPTGHVFIIFELDGFERHTHDNNTPKPKANFRRVWLSDVHRNYISISAHENSELFVIQFAPFGAYPFLHTHIDQFAEHIIPGEEILNGDLLRVAAFYAQMTQNLAPLPEAH